MFGKSLTLVSAPIVATLLASVPAAAGACVLDNASQPAATPTSTDTYGDRNRGGPYGFYSYPRHRSVDAAVTDRGLSLDPGDPSHSSADGKYGSAYYGRDYGAPYHGGGYYDRGTYYRERRD